jgi:hypothetical protein
MRIVDWKNGDIIDSRMLAIILGPYTLHETSEWKRII